MRKLFTHQPQTESSSRALSYWRTEWDSAKTVAASFSVRGKRDRAEGGIGYEFGWTLLVSSFRHWPAYISQKSSVRQQAHHTCTSTNSAPRHHQATCDVALPQISFAMALSPRFEWFHFATDLISYGSVATFPVMRAYPRIWSLLFAIQFIAAFGMDRRPNVRPRIVDLRGSSW